MSIRFKCCICGDFSGPFNEAEDRTAAVAYGTLKGRASVKICRRCLDQDAETRRQADEQERDS